jgi:hypothetical protein
VAFPVAIPETRPDRGTTLAIVGREDVHEPPEMDALKELVVPIHNPVPPGNNRNRIY